MWNLLFSLQVAATVENYAAVARTEVKEGRLFEDIQGLLSTAAESVKQAGSRMQEAGTAGPLPVEQASRLLGDALAALSTVAERAHAFDSAHGFSVKLYTTVADGVEAVRHGTAGSSNSAITRRPGLSFRRHWRRR